VEPASLKANTGAKLIIPIELDGFVFTNECHSEHRELLRRRVGARLSDPSKRAIELDRILAALKVGGPLGPRVPPQKLKGRTEAEGAS
jgi:hypothetical protein